MGAVASEVPSPSPSCVWPQRHRTAVLAPAPRPRSGRWPPELPRPPPHVSGPLGSLCLARRGIHCLERGPHREGVGGLGQLTEPLSGTLQGDLAREEPRGQGTSQEKAPLRFHCHKFNVFKHWQNPTSTRLTQPFPPSRQISLRGHRPSFSLPLGLSLNPGPHSPRTPSSFRRATADTEPPCPGAGGPAPAPCQPPCSLRWDVPFSIASPPRVAGQ